MATKTLTLLYQEDVNGTPVGITGATATVAVIRLSDGYHYNITTNAFVTPSSSSPVVMTEVDAVGNPGLYTSSIYYTNWQDDTYVFNVSATKTGETPFGYVEVMTLASGIISADVNVDPAPANFSVCYAFLNDKPASCPTDMKARYVSGWGFLNVMVPLSSTPTYDPATGMVYWTLIQGATVEVRSVSRGLFKTFVIPSLSTTSILTAQEVV